MKPPHSVVPDRSEILRSMDYASAIAAGDISVFRVPSQTTVDDRWSLLRLQRLVRQAYRPYSYLEVGSHLGGSIFPHLVDERCSSIVSIDPRPEAQPDQRGRDFFYDGNTTRRMLDTLSAAAGEAALVKIRTFDSDVSTVAPKQVGRNIRLALIDGEHTNRAAFRDFSQVLKMVERDSIIAFHDSNI